MDLKLRGKVCLVTGSSSGIGAGIARALVAEGAHVAIHGRNVERSKQVADELRSAGGRTIVTIGNLRAPAEVARITEEVTAQLGPIDVLVNNAGQANARGDPDWLSVTDDEFSERFDENVLSGVRLIRHVVPGMKSRGWGRVIMMSTAGATQPVATIPDYQASKAAIVNLTVSLARSLASTGVTVNCVSPGPILTPLLHGFLRHVARDRGWGEDDRIIEQRASQEFFGLAVKQMGRVEDVGNLTAYLASPLTNYITGANFRIDGGMVKSIN